MPLHPTKCAWLTQNCWSADSWYYIWHQHGCGILITGCTQSPCGVIAFPHITHRCSWAPRRCIYTTRTTHTHTHTHTDTHNDMCMDACTNACTAMTVNAWSLQWSGSSPLMSNLNKNLCFHVEGSFLHECCLSISASYKPPQTVNVIVLQQHSNRLVSQWITSKQSMWHNTKKWTSKNTISKYSPRNEIDNSNKGYSHATECSTLTPSHKQ